MGFGEVRKLRRGASYRVSSLDKTPDHPSPFSSPVSLCCKSNSHKAFNHLGSYRITTGCKPLGLHGCKTGALWNKGGVVENTTKSGNVRSG
jgi:hypothetical protein